MTLFFDGWENMFGIEMPSVEIDKENAVIIIYYAAEQKPVTSHIMATTMSADDKNIKIFTVEGQTNKGWREQLIYWDTTNKLLKFALPDSNPNGLVNYLEYQYE